MSGQLQAYRGECGNIQSFFERMERPTDVRLLWEPRGDWPDDIIQSVCSSCDLIHVVDPFVNKTITKGTIYYRLHGITGSRHVYSNEELLQLRDRVPSTGECYVLFNNIPRVADALRFGNLLGEGLLPEVSPS